LAHSVGFTTSQRTTW